MRKGVNNFASSINGVILVKITVSNTTNGIPKDPGRPGHQR